MKANLVVGDPSYFRQVGGKSLVRETVKVVRAICILKHPIPNTDNSDSVQLIIPQNQVGRKNDIYIAEVSSAHNICAKGIYVAQVSTIVETDKPELELRPGLDLLGEILDKFVTVASLEEPLDSGRDSNIYITRSYDPTSHFETVVEDIHDVWRRMTGHPLVLKKRQEQEEDGAQVQS